MISFFVEFIVGSASLILAFNYRINQIWNINGFIAKNLHIGVLLLTFVSKDVDFVIIASDFLIL